MLPVTAVTAVLLASAVQALGFVAIGRRRAIKVAVGDGANEPLTRAIRAQGNLVEYGIYFLALLGLAELNAAPPVWLVVLAAVFLIGRASHAYGLLVAEPRGGPGALNFRMAGMIATFTVLPLTSLTVLFGVVL